MEKPSREQTGANKEKLAHDISLNSEKLFLTQNVMIMMPPVLSS
jgi:hypothetical protein